MASIKIKYRPSTVKGEKGTLYYQIIHKRVVRQISTSYKVYGNEWDGFSQSIVFPSDMADEARKNDLTFMDEMIKSEHRYLCRIIASLEVKAEIYSADSVVNAFYRLSRENTLVSFMQSIIAQMKRYGQCCTSRNYASTLRSFMRFRKGRDIPLEMLDATLIREYEVYLKQVSVTRNTSSFYMRILRAVYNRAVERELIVQQYPFRHVYTGIDKTRKRALSFHAVKSIKDVNLAQSSSADFARDMFMMSFYLRGMSFVDMAHLRKSDLHDGYLSYNRSKTRQQLHVKWEDKMQEIVEKYQHLTQSSDYLLPIIALPNADEDKLYHNTENRITYHLKKIAVEAGIKGALTLYVARHSWATIARDRHVPLSVISEALGHDSEQTTQIYLSSIQTSEVDKANANILNDL